MKTTTMNIQLDQVDIWRFLAGIFSFIPFFGWFVIRKWLSRERGSISTEIKLEDVAQMKEMKVLLDAFEKRYEDKQEKILIHQERLDANYKSLKGQIDTLAGQMRHDLGRICDKIDAMSTKKS